MTSRALLELIEKNMDSRRRDAFDRICAVDAVFLSIVSTCLQWVWVLFAGDTILKISRNRLTINDQTISIDYIYRNPRSN